MEIKFDEKTDKFSIAELTFEQLNHVLNCIMFAADKGAEMPKEKPKKKNNGNGKDNS